MEIVGYVASEEGFFDTPCCIDCEIEKYCAFDNADRVLGVDRVYKKRLINIGEGIVISEPVIMEKRLRVEGRDFCASLSHQGVLAIYSYDRNHVIQFTNLVSEMQVEVEVEDTSNITLYDDKMILLTCYKPLREARVGEVFNKKRVSVFKRIGDVDEVDPFTDTSLVHSRRILCYASTESILYEFNVNTRENKKIEMERKVLFFSSLMGINSGVKAVFQDVDNHFTYSLDWDNRIIPLHEAREFDFTSLFVSSINPKDLSKCVLKYSNYLIKGGKRIEPRKPIYFEDFYSVMRIYRDVFLLLDRNTNNWVLSRILIP